MNSSIFIKSAVFLRSFWILGIGIFFITSGCQDAFWKKEKSRKEEVSAQQLDSDRTRSLILTILEEEKNDYFSSECISVELSEIEMPVKPDYPELLQEKLHIFDPKHLHNQIELRNNFSLSKNLVSEKRIISTDEMDHFRKKKAETDFSFSEWLGQNCSGNYSAISKPVFNETFDLGLVQIGNYCDLCCCGSGETRIYEYRSGYWFIKEKVISWVK